MTEINSLFASYGYWAVAIMLLLENAGFPVPGETVLLYAGVLAHSSSRLSLPVVIIVGVVAATAGDNIGFAIGRHGGRPLLDRYGALFHIKSGTIGRGEQLVERYGAPAVFLARFITGLRILAGPIAGSLRMPWKNFFFFNFLGALAWVTAVALTGYFFSAEFQLLITLFRRVQILVLLTGVAIVLVWLWYRFRRKGE